MSSADYTPLLPPEDTNDDDQYDVVMVIVNPFQVTETSANFTKSFTKD
jgi:hypothetical protein